MADTEAEEAHEEHQEAKKADAEAEARFLQSGKIVLIQNCHLGYVNFARGALGNENARCMFI